MKKRKLVDTSRQKFNCVPRIAHLVTTLGNGGMENLVVEWTRLRNQFAKDSTFIYCLDKPGELAVKVEDKCIHAFKADRQIFPWDRNAVAELRRELISKKIDIIHSHNLSAMQYGAFASLRTYLKHVYTEHGGYTAMRTFKNRLRLSLLSLFTNRIVAVSTDTASNLRKFYWILPKRIQIITNGVRKHPLFSFEEIERLKEKFCISKDAFVIGSVSNLTKRKAWDRFLPVFRDLTLHFFSRSYPRDFILILVGDGPEKKNLENLALNLGISEKVRFVGYQSEPRIFLNLMDVFVLASYGEGLSIALMEAMAAGLPAIVTDVGDNSDLITISVGGIVLPKSVADWMPTIKDFLLYSDRLKEIGKFGKDHVLSSRSFEINAQNYENLYKSLMLDNYY